MAEKDEFSKPVHVQNPRSHEQYSRDEKGRASAALERARQAKQQVPPQRVESEQVKQSAPGMKPTPSGSMRAGPDRQAHTQAMKQDDNAAKLERARQKAASANKNKSKGKDSENENGMER